MTYRVQGKHFPFAAEEEAVTEGKEPVRAELLGEAKSLICGDRNDQYGEPHDDFRRTADILTALGFRHQGGKISAHDIAVIMAVVKLSRITQSPEKRDHWTDLAGYAACGYECVLEEKKGPVTYPSPGWGTGGASSRKEER